MKLNERYKLYGVLKTYYLKHETKNSRMMKISVNNDIIIQITMYRYKRVTKYGV